MTAEIGQRPRFEKQPLIAEFVGEIGRARGAQEREGAVGLAVHQIDYGQSRRHLRARSTLQPAIDLILQKIRSLIQQVDRDETIGQAADHLVAAAADRRQLAEIVKQSQRINGRKPVALAGKEQRFECRRRLVLDPARHVGIRMRGHRVTHDIERIAVAPPFGVKPKH